MSDTDQVTVLFSSAGRRVELINCFREDAAMLGISLRVLAVDMHPEVSAACQAADRSWTVPRCTTPDYVGRLLEICREEGVDLLVPTIDTELAVLSAATDQFAKLGTRVAVSGPDVVRMARDKLATARFLEANGLPVPRTESLEHLLKDPGDWRWPVMLKPVDGSCSIGIHLVQNVADLDRLPDLKGSYIAQEYRRGREYTVNFFMDQSGQFRCAVPHERLETRAGEVSKGVTERHSGLLEMAGKFAAALSGGRAVMCFQVIMDDEGPWIFELNARFGGGYPLAHRAGARYSQWLLEEVTGRAPSYTDEWTNGLKMLRYDAAVFV